MNYNLLVCRQTCIAKAIYVYIRCTIKMCRIFMWQLWHMHYKNSGERHHVMHLMAPNTLRVKKEKKKKNG